MGKLSSQTLLKRRQWPTNIGKMLSIISHEGNANQNSEDSLKKKKKEKC
jgi:hypothetical protein